MRVIVKQQDNHRDNHSQIRPRILVRKVWRVQLFTLNTIVQRSTNYWVVASVMIIDYCPESNLISMITVYSSHCLAVPSTGSVDNYVLTDISVRFFGNRMSSLDTSYGGGTEVCMLGMSSGMCNRARVTYIPSKRDRQFAEKNNMYVKPKKSVPFCLTTAMPLPHGCWIRRMVVFVFGVAAKQCGAVKRSANHISEDMQSGQPTVECFMQWRMEEAIYLMTRAECCVSVLFDKLANAWSMLVLFCLLQFMLQVQK